MSENTNKVGDVNVTLKPSEQIARAAAKEFEVLDDLGRIIKLKKPNPLANLDFAKASGGEKLNVSYLSEVFHLKYVAGIDGDIVITPSTEGELRALYKRLGDEGNQAAMLGVMEHFLNPQSEQKSDSELKNS